MIRIYKLSLNLYINLLMIIVPLALIAHFFVAVSGHNSPLGFSYYLSHAYAIVMLALLITFKMRRQHQDKFGKVLRQTITTLLALSLILLLRDLYDSYELYNNGNFQLEDNFVVAFIVLFMILTSVLLYGICKKKI